MVRSVALVIALVGISLVIGCGGDASRSNTAPSVPNVTGHTETPVTNAFNFQFFWDPSIDPDGNTPVEYYVELHQVTQGPITFPFDFVNDAVLYAVSGWNEATNFEIHGVPNGSDYVMRVKARDNRGAQSAWGVYEDTTLGSCPFVFSWDGSKYAFESDVFPGGRLGTRASFGYIPPYPIDYYVMTTTPALKDGAYEIQLTGERREVEYVDEVQLVALYHPETTALVAERAPLGVSTFPGIERIHTVTLPFGTPVSAVHLNTGENVTETLAAMDDDYVTLNEDENVDYEYQTLELDLGDLSGAPQIKLIIDGQAVYPTTPEGAARAGLFGPQTRLEVPDANGNWVDVPRNIVELPNLTGFRRVIALDITDAFEADDYRIRLTWLFKKLVDAVLVDTSVDEPIRTVTLPFLSADLHYRGFSGRTGGERYELVYDPPSTTTPDYFPGAYTKYGDVKELLTDSDDRFVIFFGGDEITLRFGPAEAPEGGELIGFAIMTNGYYKDARIDLPATVEPLPFGAMSNYPYGPDENYPDDAFHDDYRAIWNTRVHPPK